MKDHKGGIIGVIQLRTGQSRAQQIIDATGDRVSAGAMGLLLAVTHNRLRYLALTA